MTRDTSHVMEEIRKASNSTKEHFGPSVERGNKISLFHTLSKEHLKKYTRHHKWKVAIKLNITFMSILRGFVVHLTA